MGNIAISVRGLEKSYGKERVLKGVSFDVESDRVVGFLGPNGAGKTTTIKLILGFLNPDAGSIEIMGEKKRRDKIMVNIGYVSEAPKFYPYLTGRQLLNLTGRLLKMKSEALNREIEKIAEYLNLKEFIDKKISTYSLGNLKKLAFAQAILGDPKILIFDEPYNGLDPIAINKVRKMIIELKEKGKTIFVSSHLLAEMERICDDVIMINKGSIVISGNIDKLKKSYKIFSSLKYTESLQKILENKGIEMGNFNLSYTLRLQDEEFKKLIKLLEENVSMDFKTLPSLEDVFLNIVQ
jgi:ABC-2 type transport system ATP-binding protein